MKISRIISVICAGLCAISVLYPTAQVKASAADDYTEGSVVAKLDDMFASDANSNESCLIKPVVKLNEYNGMIKPMESFNGSAYTSRYSGTAFQKAGVNDQPYAGVNFSRANEPGGVAITAPVDGTYTLKGLFNRYDERTDSIFTQSWIYATVNNEGDYLFSKKFWRTEGGVAAEATVSLKKGDIIYVFSDPNGGDNAWWEDFTHFIELSLTLEKLGYNAEDNYKTWKAGDEIGNIASLFDRNVFELDGCLMYPVVKFLKSGEIKNLDSYATTNYGGAGSSLTIFKEGTNGEPYVGTNFGTGWEAAGIAFVAPIDGKYQLCGLFDRKNDSTDEGVFTQSWIYATLNDTGDPIFSEKFWKTEGGVAADVSFEMKAGDILYVFSDPNGGDNAWWEDCCYIMELSLTVTEITGEQPKPPVTSDTDDDTTVPDTTKGETSDSTTETNSDIGALTTAPGTDSDTSSENGGAKYVIVIVATVVVIAAAICSILIIRHKKSSRG